MKRKWKETKIIFLLICLISSAATVFLYRIDPELIKGIDLKITDVRFRLRKGAEPDRRIAIVAIDQKSINKIGRWPWSRKILASLIDSLSGYYKVKEIVFDIVFSEKSDPMSDQLLAESIRKAGNVILGYFFRYNRENPHPDSLRKLKETQIGLIKFIGKVKDIPVPEFPFVELNIPEISKSAKNLGFFNIFPDKDGICRNYNLIALYEGGFYPSLSLSAAEEFLSSEPVISIAEYGIDSILIGKKKIKVDELGRAVINYYSRDQFSVFSAVDIIERKVPKKALKGKIVFVGATEVGIYDMRATPIDPAFPGVFIHATVLSNIIQERFLIRDGRVIALEVIFIIIFPLILFVFLSLIKNALISVFFFLAIFGIYGLLNIWLFSRFGLNLGFIYPCISLFLSYTGCEAYRNLVEVKKRRFLEKAFSSYVSPELVSQIVKNPDMLKLGGEKRKITVLFSDIRGFTSLSEKYPPETIVKMLNRYLDPMTNIVFSNKGTLDKYIGDAIMAIYNAPVDVEEHAYLACKSAVEMISALKEVNRQFKELGFPEIDIGIGINTGDAIVGNMGTDIRFDYTAIGDTVNLASRLESLNKQYGTHIIVSEYTKEMIKDNSFRFRELDRIRVKGKELPVTIYELVTEKMEEEALNLFHKALYLYRNREFKKALSYFLILKEEYNDRVADLFIERCKRYLDEPPPKDWNGVYVAERK